MSYSGFHTAKGSLLLRLRVQVQIASSFRLADGFSHCIQRHGSVTMQGTTTLLTTTVGCAPNHERGSQAWFELLELLYHMDYPVESGMESKTFDYGLFSSHCHLLAVATVPGSGLDHTTKHEHLHHRILKWPT
jgi:hypothetical protein